MNLPNRTLALAMCFAITSAVAQGSAAPATGTSTPPATSAAYPTKPIRVIVPYAPGGGGDTVFRTITEPLAVRVGQPVVMDYHAGAGGTIGLGVLAHAAADGYSIGIGSSDAVALAPNFYPKLGYDPLKDLAPVAIVAEMPLVLMVRTDSPIRSVADMLAKATARPGSISYGTPGRGSSPHIMGELLARGARVELNHIPYKGTGPAIQDLLGGHVDSVVVSGFDSVPLEKAGRVRTLAVTGTQRYVLLPQTPTFRESGVATLDDLRVWFGLFAPASTPRSSVDRLSTEIAAIVSTDEFSRRASELGFVPVKATPDEVRQRVRADVANLADMVKRTGVKPD